MRAQSLESFERKHRGDWAAVGLREAVVVACSGADESIAVGVGTKRTREIRTDVGKLDVAVDDVAGRSACEREELVGTRHELDAALELQTPAGDSLQGALVVDDLASREVEGEPRQQRIADRGDEAVTPLESSYFAQRDVRGQPRLVRSVVRRRQAMKHTHPAARDEEGAVCGGATSADLATMTCAFPAGVSNVKQPCP